MARVSTPAIAGTLGTTDNAIPRADGTGGNTLQASTAIMQDTGELDLAVNASGTPALKLTQSYNSNLNAPVIDFVGGTYVVGASEANIGPEGGNPLIPCGYVKVSVNGAAFFAGDQDRYIYIQLCYEDCFTGNSLVLTPEGAKRIDALKVGDKVISQNLDVNEQRENWIKEIAVHSKAEGYAVINEKSWGVSPFHRVWANDSWKKMSEVRVGDYLRNTNGDKVWIYQLDYVQTPCTTYNLVMENQKMANYFVDSLLVHNKCPFLYHYEDNAQHPWRCQGTFLTGFDSPEKSATDRIRLKNISNKFYIRELEPETSYIRDMMLIAVANGYETELKALNGKSSVTTKQGDIVAVEFEALPEGTTELYFEASGYYVAD